MCQRNLCKEYYHKLTCYMPVLLIVYCTNAVLTLLLFLKIDIANLVDFYSSGKATVVST